MADAVTKMTDEIGNMNAEVEYLRGNNVTLSEKINREISKKEQLQNLKVKDIEYEMQERENKLIKASNTVRGKLAQAKEEINSLTKELKRIETNKSITESGSWQQEAESLQMVAEMRKQERDQLKATNNTLSIELERLSVIELQLQVTARIHHLSSSWENLIFRLKSRKLKRCLQ